MARNIISVELSDEMYNMLSTESENLELSKSDIIRLALRGYLKANLNERFGRSVMEVLTNGTASEITAPEGDRR